MMDEKIIKKSFDNLNVVLMDLQELKRQAQTHGIFTSDRDLLECSSCGLWEDVTSEGVLTVYHKDDPLPEDSGLRFREVDESSFECPGCKAIITVVARDNSENGTATGGGGG